MVEYNLIRNGILRSLTSAGTGDISLTWAELELLTDNDLNSPGVTIGSGVLYLEADLSQRIQVDGIHLYASDLTKSSNIKFYYKDEESDPYILSSTDMLGSHYETTLPDPSAPIHVLVTVSGINIDLYEFQIFNDDYIVAFGEDGTDTNKFLGDTPVGEESDPQPVALYNNESDGLTGADAYTVVDYTGDEADQYIKISSSQNGTYVGVNDGVLIEDNLLNSEIKWSQGSFTSTTVVGDNVENTTPIQVSSDLGNLPLLTTSNSWYVGSNAWDYDRVNRIIYAIGSDAGRLKLYKYPIDGSAWTYVGEVNPGVSSFTNIAVMAYMDGYVYVICRTNGTFGKYDVNGPQDNWTSLPSVGWTVSVRNTGMCGDTSLYIYAINHFEDNDSNKQFKSFDTTTSGWSTLSNAYTNGQYSPFNYNSRNCLTYDTDRDYIYMDMGTADRGGYIQRYIVATNSWNTTWLDNYYKDYLFIAAGQYTSSRIYYHHIPTDTAGYLSNPYGRWYYSNSSNAGPGKNAYILLTDAVYEGDSTPDVGVWGSQLNYSRGRLHYWQAGFHGVGSYTTPIFELEDVYDSSYFITEGTATSGTGSISFDEDVYNGSIRVKSSDTEPITVDEVYIARDQDIIQRWIPYTDGWTSTWVNAGSIDDGSYATAVNRKNGYVAMSTRYDFYNQGNRYSSKVYIYNRSAGLAYSVSKGDDHYTYAFNTFMEFDGNGGIWGWGDHSGTHNDRHLIHFDSALNVDADINDGTDFFYYGAPELDGPGLWYTNSTENVLYKLSWNGVVVQQIPLNTPRWVCPTMDNGCWVNDTSEVTLARYDEDGNLVKTVDISSAIGGKVMIFTI